MTSPATTASEAPGNAEIAGPVRFGGRIPAYGQAVGGKDGEFILNGNRIVDVLAPPSLQGVPDAYAVYVVGDSMEPRYFAGEAVFRQSAPAGAARRFRGGADRGRGRRAAARLHQALRRARRARLAARAVQPEEDAGVPGRPRHLGPPHHHGRRRLSRKDRLAVIRLIATSSPATDRACRRSDR